MFVHPPSEIARMHIVTCRKIAIVDTSTVLRMQNAKSKKEVRPRKVQKLAIVQDRGDRTLFRRNETQ